MERETPSLRELRAEDLSAVNTWAADTAFCRANGWRTGLSEADLKRWWTPLLSGGEPDFLRLGVEYEGRLIGYTDLAHLNAHSAELGIAIGESELWGRGIGRQAALLMLNHGFHTLGLSLIRSEVHATNARSLALMQRLDFSEVEPSPELEMYQDAWTALRRFELCAEHFRAQQH